MSMLSALPAPYRSPACRHSANAALDALIRLGGAALAAARHGDQPQRTPLVAGPSLRMKHRAGPQSMAHRLFDIDPAAVLGFGEPIQAHRFESNLFAPPRGLQRGSGRGNGRLQCALAHLNQGEPVVRLRVQRRRAGAPGKLEHRIRVSAGALQVTLGNEAFRAKVEQVEPAFDAQVALGQRGACLLDRLRVVARPGQFAYAFLDRRRSIRSRPPLAGPAMSSSPSNPPSVAQSLHPLQGSTCRARLRGPECGRGEPDISLPAARVNPDHVGPPSRHAGCIDVATDELSQTSPRSDSSALR